MKIRLQEAFWACWTWLDRTLCFWSWNIANTVGQVVQAAQEGYKAGKQTRLERGHP